MEKKFYYMLEICKPILILGLMVILFALLGCSPKEPEAITEKEIPAEASGALPELDQNKIMPNSIVRMQNPDYSFESSPSSETEQGKEKPFSQERDELFPLQD